MSQRKPLPSVKTSSHQSTTPTSATNDELSSLRVDAAHAVANDVSANEPVDELEEESILAELASSAPNYSADQLRNQTLQLATLLSQRQRQLDRRETELNVQTAKLEKELRAAQMWSRERQFEIGQREHRQQQEAEKLAERQERVDAAHSTFERELKVRQAELELLATRLDRQQQEHSERESDFTRRQEEFELARQVRQASSLHAQRELECERQRLEHRRQQVARMFADMSKQLERRRQGIERQHQQYEADLKQRASAGWEEVNQALAELAARKEALNEHAKLLDDQQAELDQQRETLLAAREQHESQVAQQQQEFAQERQQWQATRNESETQLKRRRESLDQRTKSLQALHEEVIERNRESLELRLGAEQIWNQMAGKAAPAELTKRLGQFRNKLAQGQREERQAIQRRREEIVVLAADLQKKQANMRHRQEELANWVDRRNQDLEEQAARLVAREQELDRQEQEFAQGREDWARQRMAYQQQLRSLQTQLRQVHDQVMVVQ